MILRALRKLARDEGGQATTEYILILSMIMVVIVALIKNVIKPMFDKLRDSISRQVSQQLFGGDLHQLHVGH